MAGLKWLSTGGGSRLAAIVILSPVFVLIAALGTRTGLWSYAIGHDLLAVRVGVGLAAIGAIAAVTLVIYAARGRASPWLAALAIAVSAATVGTYALQVSRLMSGAPDDVSTDLAEIPGFGELDARRGGARAGQTAGGGACPGAVPALTQLAPASAVWALQESGFGVQGRVNVGRAAGTHRGFWFGTTHDAVIRIRPGRTDVRVAARDGRPHGGAACRLATQISERMRVVVE